jgi:hypothetical protein
MVIQICKWILSLLIAFWLVQGMNQSEARAIRPKGLELRPQVVESLKKVLQTSTQLHTALLSKDDKTIKANISSLKGTLKAALTTTYGKRTPAAVRMAYGSLDRTLSDQIMSIQKHLEKAELQKKNAQRIPHLQKAFEELVHMRKFYNLSDKSFVFFCKKDRSVWIQKASKGKNPFIEDSTCARTVLK